MSRKASEVMLWFALTTVMANSWVWCGSPLLLFSFVESWQKRAPDALSNLRARMITKFSKHDFTIKSRVVKAFATFIYTLKVVFSNAALSGYLLHVIIQASHMQSHKLMLCFAASVELVLLLFANYSCCPLAKLWAFSQCMRFKLFQCGSWHLSISFSARVAQKLCSLHMSFNVSAQTLT